MKFKSALTAFVACAAAVVSFTSRAELPAKFVEYVYSGGSVVFDTGIKPIPSKTRAIITLAPMTVSSTEKAMFGQRSSSTWGDKYSTYVLLNSSYFRMDWIGNGTTKAFIPTKEHIYQFDCRNASARINGSSYSSSVTKDGAASSYSFYLFAMNDKGKTKAGLAQRLYAARIYTDGVNVSANYLPCVDNDGVAALYDTVSGMVCYPESGTLTAGPDIVVDETKKTFFGLASDDWDTAANWLPAGVPTADDDVVIPAGKIVTAASTIAVKSLVTARATMLTVGNWPKYLWSVNYMYPFAGEGTSLGVSVTGDMSVGGCFSIGGHTNEYDAVSVSVGGNLTFGSSSSSYFYARYGDLETTWKNFTWQDFKTGGGLLTVGGKTTLEGATEASASVFTVCNPMSGLPFVLKLQDLEVAAGAKISSDNLGWAKVGDTFYGKGFSNKGGAGYGGQGGGGTRGASYGFANAPCYPGSPSFVITSTKTPKPDYRGGGAIRIDARDVTVNGKLTALASDRSGTAASGGGIFVTCREFAVGETALVTARGGDNTGNNNTEYSGGGGRIAIVTGSPTDEQLNGLYANGSDDGVMEVCSLLDASASPYPVSCFSVQGGHQTDYASNPTKAGNGKDGTAVLLNARDMSMAFVTVDGARTPEDVVPHFGTRQIKKGETLFSNSDYSYIARAGNLTRDVCSGYTYTNATEGVVSGEVTSVTLNIQEDTTLTWLYAEQPEHFVTVMKPNAEGVMTSTSAWMTNGTDLDLSADEIDGYVFAGWEGDVPVADRANAAVTLTVDRPLRMTAVYRKEGAEPSAKTWTGAGDGTTWEDPANWDPAGIPTINDAVTLPSDATVFAKSHAVAGSLALDSGAFLKIAAVGTSVANAWEMQPEIPAIRLALGLRVAGDLTLTDAKLVVGGFNSYAEDVKLDVGGDLTLNGASRLVVNARYGARSLGAKSWRSFTWQDFKAGGATVSVAGATKVLDTSVVYPTCNARSGLPVVFALKDLELASGASFSATMRGWAYIAADLTHYGYGYAAEGSAASYGGKGGGNSAAGTYGFANAPFYPGSAGGRTDEYAAGGGAVRICADDVKLDGKIYADGWQGTGDALVLGSGGSIFITCDTLKPGASAQLSARGGLNPGNEVIGKCGGGGRISVIVGSPDEELLDALYATGTEAEKFILVTDDPAVANADRATYPAITVIGGHGKNWDTNPQAAWHGKDGSFVWAKNRGNKASVTVKAGLPTATVNPPDGVDTVEKGEMNFTADESAADPEYPTGGRFHVQGLSWSNATENVSHFVAGNDVRMTVDDDLWVEWIWGDREYLFDIVSAGGGTVTGDGWQDEGASVTLTATPAAGWTFVGWAGDVPAADRTKASVTLAADGPKRAVALFSDGTASVCVWRPDGTGVWSDPQNWDCGAGVPGKVPTALDDVVLTNGTCVIDDSLDLTVASLVVSNSAKLFIGCRGTSAQTADAIDTETTTPWALRVTGAMSVVGTAQFAIGGRIGEAEAVLEAGSLALSGSAAAAVYSGRRGPSDDPATFREGGAKVVVAGEMTLGGKSVLGLFCHPESGAPVVISAGTFTLGATAKVDADGNGFGRRAAYTAGGTWAPRFFGPGYVLCGYTANRNGASYGGEGGGILSAGAESRVYGWAAAPFMPGSPAHNILTTDERYFGGGAVRIDARMLTINGTITACGADGKSSTENGGGASGGAIWLTGNRIEIGSGAQLLAKGGNSTGYEYSCGGGGGRIAIGRKLTSDQIDRLYVGDLPVSVEVTPLSGLPEYAGRFSVKGGTAHQQADRSGIAGTDGSAVFVNAKSGLVIMIR